VGGAFSSGRPVLSSTPVLFRCQVVEIMMSVMTLFCLFMSCSCTVYLRFSGFGLNKSHVYDCI
jgi:hypothetical protein